MPVWKQLHKLEPACFMIFITVLNKPKMRLMKLMKIKKKLPHWIVIITFPDAMNVRPTGLRPGATDTNTWESLNFIEAEEPERQ